MSLPLPILLRHVTTDHSTRRYLAILIVCIAITYVQTLTYNFVDYDDYDLIRNNTEFLGNFSNIPVSFTTHAFSTHRAQGVYYRPLLLTSYILDYHIWQLNPLGYHLTNVLIHCFSCLMVFLLLNLLARNRSIALFGALLFALHPIQTEAVGWISGRNDLLLGLFVISMIYFYNRQYENPSEARLYRALTLICFVLALFTKETAAYYLLLLPISDICLRRQRLRALIRRPFVTTYLILGLVLAIYILIRVSIFGEMLGGETLYGRITFMGRVKLTPAMISEHLFLLLAPVRLCIEHPLDQLIWLSSPWNLAALAICAGLIGLIFWTWRMNRLACFGVMWLCLGLLTVSNIIPVAVPILEHRLYIVSIGFTILVASLIHHLLPADQRWNRAGTILMVAIVGVAGILSFLRLPAWKNTETLETDAIEKAPTSSRSYFNLAAYCYEHSDYDRTISLLNQYVKLNPDNVALGYEKLQLTYVQANRISEAIEATNRLIELEPRNPNHYEEASSLFRRLNLPDSAISVLRKGLQFDSTSAYLRVRLGVLYEDLGDTAEASNEYRRAIEVNAGYGPSYFRLGRLFALRGNDETAIRYLEQGIKLWAPPAEVVELLEQLYNRTGQPDKARSLSNSLQTVPGEQQQK